MSIKETSISSDSRAASKHRTYITILETYVAILGTILGLVFTWSQLRISQNEDDRSRRAEPLSYTLEAVNTHYQYDIQQEGVAMSIPAPSLRLHVTHGSLSSITAISFDGSAFHELSDLPILDRWEGCTVDVTMPAESLIVNGNLVYDYFFLFLQPTEGENQLDLICNTISLDTQEVQTSIFHPIALAQLSYLADSPQKELLLVYNALLNDFKGLGLL